MTTEWGFVFLNTAVIIFCLIYSLNIPQTVIKAHHFFLCKHVSVRPKVNSNQSEISLRGKLSHWCKVTSLLAFT